MVSVMGRKSIALCGKPIQDEKKKKKDMMYGHTLTRNSALSPRPEFKTNYRARTRFFHLAFLSRYSAPSKPASAEK